MYNRFLLILVFVLTLTSASKARQRTLSEMQAIASKAIAKGVAVQTRNEHSLQELYTTPMLSMLGTPGGGFAIIARDDRYPAVLGYSTSKADGQLTDGLIWWINAVNHAMESDVIAMQATTVLSSHSALAKAVEPLLTSVWNQNNPYNYHCPSMATKGNYPTGCVATALSQIMRYHKYPEKGQGTYTYVFRPSDGTAYQLTANFGETTYDWDNMLDSYKSGYTDVQRDAVAILMSHIGISVQMAYNPSGSGAYSVEAANALRNYFRYNENVRLYRRDFYSAQLWMQMLYNELNRQRPVYYTGVDPTNGGHAFVIDGYDEQGLVHVNWGWGGSNDGYYDIALLNPSSEKFSEGQEMVTNICRPEVTTDFESQLASTGLNINFYGSGTIRLTMSAKVYDVGADKFDGRVAAILQSSDTTIVAKVQENVVLSPASLGFMKAADISLRGMEISDIPDGTYRVYMGARSQKDDKWQLVRTYEGMRNSYLLVKSGSEYTTTETTDDMWMTTDLPYTTDKRSSKTHIYDLQGKQHGKAPNALPHGIYIIDGRKVVK